MAKCQSAGCNVMQRLLRELRQELTIFRAVDADVGGQQGESGEVAGDEAPAANERPVGVSAVFWAYRVWAGVLYCILLDI